MKTVVNIPRAFTRSICAYLFCGLACVVHGQSISPLAWIDQVNTQTGKAWNNMLIAVEFKAFNGHYAKSPIETLKANYLKSEQKYILDFGNRMTLFSGDEYMELDKERRLIVVADMSNEDIISNFNPEPLSRNQFLQMASNLMFLKSEAGTRKVRIAFDQSPMFHYAAIEVTASTQTMQIQKICLYYRNSFTQFLPQGNYEDKPRLEIYYQPVRSLKEGDPAFSTSTYIEKHPSGKYQGRAAFASYEVIEINTNP